MKKTRKKKSSNVVIYILLFLWIAVATCAAVYFGLEYYGMKGADKIPDGLPSGEVVVIDPENTDLPEAEQTVQAEQLVIPQGTSAEQIFLALSSMGYTPEEMLSLIETGNKDSFRAYVEQYIEANPDLAKVDVDTTHESDTAPEYTKLYPDMYVENKPAAFREDEGTIYLTFDDGPSKRTPEVLDILKKYNVNATFFVCGGTSDDAKALMKRVVDEGHTIGIHSISHDYKKIYADVDSYLADFYETYMCVYEATGVKPEIFRFPGGSINNYNRFTYQQIIAEMTRRGFVYYDWDVSGEDAVKGADQKSIYSNIMNYISTDGNDRAIVLLHDAADKEDTVAILPSVIEQLYGYGYKFDRIDNGVKPIAFGYR